MCFQIIIFSYQTSFIKYISVDFVMEKKMHCLGHIKIIGSVQKELHKQQLGNKLLLCISSSLFPICNLSLKYLQSESNGENTGVFFFFKD